MAPKEPDGRDMVWRKANAELEKKNLQPTLKGFKAAPPGGGGSVMVWGWMSASGFGELMFVDGVMDKMKKSNTETMNNVNDASELNPWPPFIEERLDLWDKLMAKYVAEIESKEHNPISITLPDGAVKEGLSWKTTPYDIAAEISQGLADNTVIAKVDDELWDLDRPLVKDCKLSLLKFDDPEAQAVFWHSSAHILGEALERTIGGHLCYGPPIHSGFYYDMFTPTKQVSSTDYPGIEQVVKKIVKEKQPFERLEVSVDDLLEMFKYNEFKVRILKEKVKTPTTTIYRCGPLIDLCRGPHVRHTGKVKSFKVTKVCEYVTHNLVYIQLCMVF
uniref:threonine--tRNA ligase n=1 Tax=Rhodnius prolixus TaxID=13249 RepID=T1I358_RHOPR